MDKPRTRQLTRDERQSLADAANDLRDEDDTTYESSEETIDEIDEIEEQAGTMAAAAAEKAAKDREDFLMDRFQRMQDGMTKAFSDLHRDSGADADRRQTDMLEKLIPKLIQNQPGVGVKTGGNNLVSASSHAMPSTGLISAAASGYDHQASPLAHMIGDLSSGITVNDQGNRNSSS
jgi:hypothetical protein